MFDITKTPEDCTSTKRQVHMTEKAKEEHLQRHVQSRKTKLAQLIGKSHKLWIMLHMLILFKLN